MSERTGPSPVNRDGIESALWRWSGWKADQVLVDALLDHVDRYKVTAPDADPIVRRIVDQAHNEAERIVEAARAAAEAMRPPPALCMGCQAAVSEAQAKREATVRKKRVRVPETDRRCADCKAVKGIDRFNRDVKARNGRKPMCKDCEADRRAARPTVAKAAGKRALNIKVAT